MANAKNGALPSQQFVDIAEIRNGVVILKNGSLRQIVMVGGINFDLKSEEEQNLILFNYQNFLNSLDFSVQLLVHSRKLDIEKYLAKIKDIESKEANELLKNQLLEYHEFIKSFVGVNDIMNKAFFAIVPYDPISIPGAAKKDELFSFFKKKKKGVAVPNEGSPAEHITTDADRAFTRNFEQLSQRTDQVVSGLNAIGLRALPLVNDELVALFYNFYNPSVTERRTITLPKNRLSDQEIKDLVAPSALEINPNHLKLGDQFVKTFFVFTYPRYLSSGWFSPIINLPNLLDISIFIHPLDPSLAMKNLRKKTAHVQAQLSENEEKGLVRDPILETAYQDIETLRDSLQQGTERLFNASVYITIYASTLEALGKLESQITNMLEGLLVYIKPATFQQVEAYSSVLPLGRDQLSITNPLNSGPISSFFPFVSSMLTSDEGVLYGLNRHNNTLVIFDRFSLENGNSVIIATSGAGKSYTAKVEILRLLMTGTDVLVIDPENEFEKLAETVGGSYIKVSLGSDSHINPFDIPPIPEGEDPSEVLRSHIADLSSFMKLLLTKKDEHLTAQEEALLDRALIEAYASRDIVPGKDFSGATPPLLSDLEGILKTMEGGEDLAARLYPYTQGTRATFINQATNVDMTNRMVVFGMRDLEQELRPIAMYFVINFVWNTIRARMKRRVLLIDEAWYMMLNEDSARFLFALAKRCRKYYLGLTTITQQINDFLKSSYGQPIISNSAIQILLKQKPDQINLVGEAFNLTEAEKSLLLESQVGNGLFFAGPNHVAIRIVASYLEDKIVTTKPEQVLEEKSQSL